VQLTTEVAGQAGTLARAAGRAAVVQPQAAQLATQGQQAQADAEAHEQLQKELQHHGDQGRQAAGRHAGASPRCPSLTPSPPEPGCDPAADAAEEPLPPLNDAELETLLAALDPLLDGFGDGDSCLDDARAFVARLGIGVESQARLLEWLERWGASGGTRRTLRLMVRTWLAHRS
jgi:hypothetical protein